MLTATCEPTRVDLTPKTQNETLPSDLEVMRRVRNIKSGWSPSECIRRRREAEDRFVDLMCKLGVEAA
mgnify:CR=1 FL=1